MLPSSGSTPPPSDTGESLKWPRLDRVVGRGRGRGDTGGGMGKGGHGGRGDSWNGREHQYPHRLVPSRNID